MELDLRFFLWIRSAGPRPLLDVLARTLSIFGAWILVPTVLGLLWRVVPAGRFRHLARRFLTGIGVFTLVLADLKYGFGAPRPARRLHPEIVAGTYEVRLLEEDPPMGRSFPSGHAALAFFGCLWLAAERRRWLLPGLILATAIAWSRVYAGVHFPIDCLAGAVLGALGMAWSRRAWPGLASSSGDSRSPIIRQEDLSAAPAPGPRQQFNLSVSPAPRRVPMSKRDDARAFEMGLEIAAPTESVWSALSTAEGFERWLCPGRS